MHCFSAGKTMLSCGRGGALWRGIGAFLFFFLSDCRIRGKGMSAESGYVSGKAGNCLLVQETECSANQEINCFYAFRMQENIEFIFTFVNLHNYKLQLQLGQYRFLLASPMPLIYMFIILYIIYIIIIYI